MKKLILTVAVQKTFEIEEGKEKEVMQYLAEDGFMAHEMPTYSDIVKDLPITEIATHEIHSRPTERLFPHQLKEITAQIRDENNERMWANHRI